MGFNYEIASGKKDGKYKGYIKFDKDMINIFHSTAKSDKDKVGTTNLLVYVLNEINSKLNNNEDVENMVIEIDRQEIEEAIYRNPLTGKKKYDGNKNMKENKIKKAKELIDVLKEVSGVYVAVVNKITFVPFYSLISASTVDDTEPVTMKINPEFIDYFNKVRNRDGINETYGKLYFDIMLSLSTYNQKIIYAYLSSYTAQFEKHHHTNPTNIDALNKYIGNYKGTEFKDRVQDALDAINKVIKYKREKYNLFIPIYKVEWKQEDNNKKSGPTSRTTQFRFVIDEDDYKENKYKLTSIYDIANSVYDEDLASELCQFLDNLRENNKSLPNKQSFDTVVSILNQMQPEQAIDWVYASIQDGRNNIYIPEEFKPSNK